jgi:hypothetical protein
MDNGLAYTSNKGIAAMIELAVAQIVLVERNAKVNAAELRRQMVIADTGELAVAPEEPRVFGKVVDFVQRLRNTQTGQQTRALAGDAAA